MQAGVHNAVQDCGDQRDLVSEGLRGWLRGGGGGKGGMHAHPRCFAPHAGMLNSSLCLYVLFHPLCLITHPLLSYPIASSSLPPTKGTTPLTPMKPPTR